MAQVIINNISIFIPEEGYTGAKFSRGRVVVPKKEHVARWRLGVIKERVVSAQGVILRITDLEHLSCLYKETLSRTESIISTNKILDDVTDDRIIRPWIVVPMDNCRVPWQIAEVIKFKDDGLLCVKDIITRESCTIKDMYVKTLMRDIHE